MKNVLIGILLVITGWASAQPVLVNAQSALVIDAETGEVIMGKNNDQVRSIASITKLMTAVVVLDKQLPLDEEIEITAEEVHGTMLRGRPTSGSLRTGTKLTRAELLHLALMNSQNRAAYALGRAYPGGIEAFVADMNVKATALGMANTKFVDPTGLYNENMSSADDLAKLVKASADYPEIRDFSTSTSFQTTAFVQNKMRKLGFGTTNRLLTKDRWDVVVQKTGYIRAAGRCLTMMVNIASRKVIIVLLNTSDPHARALDAISVMYWVENQQIATRAKLQELNPYKGKRRRKR